MVHFYSRILYIVGFITGVFLACFFVPQRNILKTNDEVAPFKNRGYEKWFLQHGLKRKALLWDDLRYNTKKYTTESQYLHDKIKVVCIVLVRRESNVKAIRDTWGQGCNDINFVMLSKKKKNTLQIKRTSSNSSWVYLCHALKKVPDLYSWIVVVNDNSFVIVENLRKMVAPLNPSNSYYLGHTVKFWNVNYNSADAGYILSKGAVKKFKTKFNSTCLSDLTYWNKEDYYLGKNLAQLNVTPADTRDDEGLSTFHPYNWYHVFFPGENYYKLSVYPPKCCSKNSITFQAIESDKMYMYYYLLYRVQLFFDGNLGNVPAPTPLPKDEVWKRFLRERNVKTDNVSSQQYYKIWEDLIDDPNSFAKNMKREQYSDYT